VQEGKLEMNLAVMLILWGVLAIGVITDLGWSRIPNWLTFPAMVAGITAHSWSNGVEGAVFAVVGLTVGLGVFLVLYLMGSMGAGDVKLLAAVGTLVGPYGALVSGIFAMVIGGAYALCAMWYRWGSSEMITRLAVAGQGALLKGGTSWMQDLALPFRLRYGLAIAAGTLLFQLGLYSFGG
jgi:prepilin peptidase CpaA